MSKQMNIPDKERAIVLQGGGSLGAFEAGAYRALYEKLSEKDTREGRIGRSTFDIIAGTSIGEKQNMADSSERTIGKLGLNMLYIMTRGSHQIKSWQAHRIQSIL